MAAKNFIFREICVGSKVAGMQTNVFAVFDPTWTLVLAPKGSHDKFLKGALSRLRQFSATESPLKVRKNAFYLT